MLNDFIVNNPRSPRDIEKLISCVGRYPHVEEIVRVTGETKVDGVGILVGHVPEMINLKIMRKYRKKGKIFFFENIKVENLYELYQYAFLLVDKVDNNYVSTYSDLGQEEMGSKIGVLYFESVKSFRFKTRFKPWRLYRGEICRGKICHTFNWILHIPTYRSGVYFFLCDSKDLITLSSDKINYPLQDLLFTYNFKNPLRYMRSIVLPLFKY